MNRLKESFYLAMIILGLLALSFHLANAQTIRYWVACTVLHEDGRQCFQEYAVDVDTTGSDSAIIYFPPITRPIKFGWITDSITWVATDTTFEGDCKCEHEWVYSDNKNLTFRVGATVWRKTDGLALCSVGVHNWKRFWDEPDHTDGSHCPYEINERERICRKCLFSVIERENWFQHFVAPPKSEFEILKEKQRAKQ